jgi:hypothetical protein
MFHLVYKRVLSNLGFATVLAMVLAAFMLAPTTSHASEMKTCKLKTNDIGTILGKGKTQAAAFEDAATQCFDRHSAAYKIKKGTDLDEDAGLVVIDVCANIKCG